MAVQKILLNDLIYYTGNFHEFTDFLFSKIRKNGNEKEVIVHINLRNYYYLNKDAQFKDDIKKNCLLVFDGIGMKIGLFLKGYGMLPDLNGTDLFPLVMEKMSKSNIGVFLLGAEEKVVHDVAKSILREYPTINICGYYNGYFTDNEENEIVELINKSKADLLLISCGFPLQEQFALKYKDRLEVSLIWNVGGLFDFISGNKIRAPLLFRRLRLEWFFRLLKEPHRMLHRNTVAALWSLSHIIFKNRN